MIPKTVVCLSDRWLEAAYPTAAARAFLLRGMKLAPNAIVQVWGADDHAARLATLAEVMEIRDAEATTRAVLLMEFTFGSLQFLRTAGFGPSKAASVAELLGSVFESAAQSGWESMETAYAAFKAGLLRLSGGGADAGDEPLTTREVRAVVDHASVTFFANYAANKLAYTLASAPSLRELSALREEERAAVAAAVASADDGEGNADGEE